MRKEIISALRGYLRDNFLMNDDVDLQEDTSFMREHILDSTGFVELIAHVEEAFGIEVADDEMLPENFDSLANIARFVMGKRDLASAA